MIERRYDGPLDGALGRLQARVVACRACPRLVEYRERKATTERRASFRDQEYWGAPVPSHGDPAGRLLLVGLAPASHGANRTGRLFTGDPTADFLALALHRAGFASQPTSHHRGDGLELRDAFETAVVRCAPPEDRASPEEQRRCRPFLQEEVRLLPNVRAVLAFGHVAFDHYLRAMRESTGERLRHRFAHAGRYELEGGLPTLFASYHPSPRNTNTGRLSAEALDAVLGSIRRFLDGG
ncbi:MAG: uracil-DNA glycosylase [Chloroflexi bacterium]|nr:uracil-DNA glycosylase [Chloroflexota bacterium]